MTDASRPRVRRLGALGTLVWDTIRGRSAGDRGAVEQWGGISYSLSAFESDGPPGWELLPIVKVGDDLRDRALDLLRGFDRVASLEGIRFVDAPNNRVELRYRDRAERTERLRGGVPGWTWEELAPLAGGCDALYVNFIAGWEIDLASARRLAGTVAGPLYADLHSLFLEVGPDGIRRPRPRERAEEWVACFDAVQMNEDELRLLAAGERDPWRVARRAVGTGATRAVFVTRGRRGARWFAADGWRGARSGGGASGGEEPPGVRSGDEPLEDVVADPDPTGCGDVWGMACFGALLAGADAPEAVRRANRLAARNARRRGGAALAERPRAGGIPEGEEDA